MLNKEDKFKIRKTNEIQNLTEFGEYLGTGERIILDKSSSNNTSAPSDQVSRYYESQLLSLRTEYEMNMNNKSNEINELRNINNKILNELIGIKVEKKQLLDENNILKKAVNIQDNRYKELYNQNVKLNDVLTQAAICINDLKRNKDNNKCNCYGSSYDSFPPPPPDVY